MIGYFAFAVIFALFAAMLTAHFIAYRRAVVENHKSRLFSKFNSSLADENGDQDLVKRVFAGEVQLEQLVYVIMPKSLDTSKLEQRFSKPISVELSTLGAGEVIRSYSVDEVSGIDVQLTDFVSGIETIRQILIRQGAPSETIIEYSDSELDVYDE